LLDHYGYSGIQRVCDSCYVKQSSDTTRESVCTELDYGFSHSFELKQFGGGICDYCDTLVVDVAFYMCTVCKYTVHKKCCPLVAPNCSKPLGTTSGAVQIKLERKEIARLHQVWKENHFDKGVDSINFLSFYHKCIVPEIRDFSSNLLSRFTDNEIFRMFKYVDRDNNGSISFEEFMVFVSNLRTDNPEDQLKLTFVMYDENSDGKMTLQELTTSLSKSTSANHMFGSLGRGSSFLVECIAEDIFQAAGVDFKGTLTIDTLMIAYKNDPALLSKFCGC